MCAEYDFTGGIRGKYAKRYASGTNVVVLEPNVAEAFPTARAAASQVAPAAIRGEHQCVCALVSPQQSPVSIHPFERKTR